MAIRDRSWPRGRPGHVESNRIPLARSVLKRRQQSVDGWKRLAERRVLPGGRVLEHPEDALTEPPTLDGLRPVVAQVEPPFHLDVRVEDLIDQVVWEPGVAEAATDLVEVHGLAGAIRRRPCPVRARPRR